ncbi:MAG: hypothetical protein OET90_11880 [Desulfuromonadales bacterium]|nr:hypothetical protein [Desulfuromonadales bacterium]
MKTFQKLILLTTTLQLILPSLVLAQEADKQPNILLVMVDDMGWHD